MRNSSRLKCFKILAASASAVCTLNLSRKLSNTSYKSQLHQDSTPSVPRSNQLIPDQQSSSQYPTFIPQNVAGNKQKPHVVVLGSGWASVALIKNLSKDHTITVISPTNYFLFTPLLPSCCVGTTQINSLTEPIRNIMKKSGWTSNNGDINEVEYSYIEGAAVDLEYYDPVKFPNGSNRVLCETAESGKFYVPFDKCIIAVGSKSITFGVKGVGEYCSFLKTAGDVRKIKAKIIQNFEKASVPLLSEDQVKKLLTFVICGGGPTGVEFAAELYDYLNDDLSRFFPHLKQHVRVCIIQSVDHILNTYDEKISEYAREKFERDGIEVLLRSKVTQVEEDQLTYEFSNRDTKKVETIKIPYGLCVWTTGVGMQPLTERIVQKISSQSHSRAIVVDDRLRVKGVYQGFQNQSSQSTGLEDDFCHGNIFAVGDCSTVEVPKLVDQILDLFRQAGKEQNQSLTFSEFQQVAQVMILKYPQTQVYLQKLTHVFSEYDQNQSGSLEYKEFEQMVSDINNKLKAYPATAQVAQQQGKYIAKFLNYQLEQQKLQSGEDIGAWRKSKQLVNQYVGKFQQFGDTHRFDAKIDYHNFYPAFQYHHLGSLAYLGMSRAVIDFGGGYTFGSSDRGGLVGRLVTLYLWRGVYLSEVVSLRQRVRLASDWFMAAAFGREIARHG
ncbi:hypothetical protein MIR68_008883 [Amoeboaphelidium protococcarum]|nr:hypothetical protein MIR68_008883 [Amoeboaphelidium protococcarum]